MVRHVIVWTLKDEYSDSEKEQIKAALITKFKSKIIKANKRR
jgi:hypothetical protein